VCSRLHLLLEPAELVFEREEIPGSGQDVLAQREAELARRALIVERHASSLGECELTALQRRLARDGPQ
jgi:hypothetical protein